MLTWLLASLLVSAGLLAAAPNTCIWADAPLRAIGNLEPGHGYKGRTVTISRWLKGDGPNRLQLAWLTSGVQPGEYALYGRHIEGEVFHSVMLRSTASLSEDTRLIEILNRERNIVRGRFVAASNSITDWRPAVVQLSGRQTISSKLDASGTFEQRGLAAGVYVVSLTTPPTTAVREPANLHLDVPERGCVEQVFVVHRNTVIDKARETLESLGASLRAVREVVAESIRGSSR
jgi:hypothetical protein